MPNISEYEAPQNLGISPSETGIEATARAAQRINMYGSQEAQDLQRTGEQLGRGIANVGDAAVQYMEHREISTLGKSASAVKLTLEQQLAEKIKDPNFDPDDPSFAQKFIEENVNGALDNFQDGPITTGGQKFAQQEADQIRSGMSNQVHAAASTMAGVAIKNNAIETANNYAGAAFINPASGFDSMQSFDRTLHAKASTSPNLDAEGYARVMSETGEAGKSQIARAMIQGTIVNGGDWKKLAADPRISPYVNQAETMQFVRQEQTFQKVDEANARAARAESDYNAKKNFNGSLEKMELETIPENPGDPPKPIANFKERMTQLSTQPGADLEHGEFSAMISKQNALAEKLGKPEPLAGVSHATTMEILGDMRSGKMTSNQAIYDAYGSSAEHPNGRLNNADFNFLQNQYNQMKTPQGERLDKDRDLFFKRYQLSIDPEQGADSKQTGRQPLYEAEMAARQKEADVRSKGGDPHSVYDPSSPNFFGKPENLQRFRDRQPLQSLLTQPAAKGPDVGNVQKGYRFLGGDPSKPESWAKVQ